jgi:hypothetical protein
MNVETGTETPIFLFWDYLFYYYYYLLFCLCSVLYVLLSLYSGGVSVTQHNSDSFEFLCVDTHLVSKQNSLSRSHCSIVQFSWIETGMGEAVEGII